MSILIVVTFSLFFILIGLYVSRKGIVNFIAGYQEGSIRDEKLLAKRIGAVLIAFGLECLAVFLVHRFVVPLNSVYIGILAIIHVFIILLLFIKHRLNSL